MGLHTREWGTGDRVAVLLHGMAADSGAWWRLGPELAGRGFRVVAVDQLGHGRSPRAPFAAPEEFADAVLAAVPAEPALALGHSMGGGVLALAVERLRPGRAVYCETAFRVPDYRLTPRDIAAALTASLGAGLGAEGWRPGPEDAEAQRAAAAAWDADTAAGFVHGVSGRDLTPPLVVPSTVLVADPSVVCTPAQRTELAAAGFEVRTVPGAAHTVHQHVFEKFLATLDDRLWP
ncbi:MAG TPA: alpha/beta hydrolase [Pseudonocardiaceae bacterium]